MNKRVVLVTGGGRGIGRAISKAFAADGAIVVINYRSNREKAEELAKEIEGSGGEAMVVKADVANSAEVSDMVDAVIERYSKIDVLVNNAGISKGGLLMMLDDGDWDAVMDANLKGVYITTKRVIREMISERRGVIVNVSSLSGITGLAGETPYSAAKGGVIAFTKALSKELSPFGILVNSVAPGAIETEMLDEMPEAAREKLLELIPLKRLGKPEEVAGVVRFLASPEASYITGETVVVSGGLP